MHYGDSKMVQFLLQITRFIFIRCSSIPQHCIQFWLHFFSSHVKVFERATTAFGFISPIVAACAIIVLNKTNKIRHLMFAALFQVYKCATLQEIGFLMSYCLLYEQNSVIFIFDIVIVFDIAFHKSQHFICPTDIIVVIHPNICWWDFLAVGNCSGACNVK